MNESTAILLIDPEDLNNSKSELVAPEQAIGQNFGNVHRSVAALMMEGKTPAQIGEVLGMAHDKVRAILLMPHTQTYLTELATKQGERAVDALLKSTEFDTVMKLIEVRDSSVDRKDQLAACKQLWIMRRGNKPTKIGEDGEDDNLSGDIKEKVKTLDQQIAALQAQQAQGKNVFQEQLIQ